MHAGFAAVDGSQHDFHRPSHAYATHRSYGSVRTCIDEKSTPRWAQGQQRETSMKPPTKKQEIRRGPKKADDLQKLFCMLAGPRQLSSPCGRLPVNFCGWPRARCGLNFSLTCHELSRSSLLHVVFSPPQKNRMYALSLISQKKN